MVLLCTHWGCCPGDHGQQGLHSCFHPDAGSCLVGEARPSGRLVGGFISTRPPCCVASCCPCRAPRGEQLSYQITPGEEESWALGTVFCLQPHGCASHPGVRPLNPRGGIGCFCLFAALCPAYQGGVRGLPWHSLWSSDGD